MKLFAQLGPQLIPVRNLNEAEISDHAKYVPLIVEARNRLDLFQILQMNYREWRKYLVNEAITMAMGNRLMLYVTPKI
jgi:hypothetical protein